MGWLWSVRQPHNRQYSGNSHPPSMLNDKLAKRVRIGMSLLSDMIWSPADYLESSALIRASGEELLSRLDWMTLQPRMILDLGCGTGEMGVKLRERYQNATVVALDNSDAMIQHAHRFGQPCVCGDAGELPFPDQSMDLVFAHLVLPWHRDVKRVLQESLRVLRPEGVLIVTALGPDTFKEWRDLFSTQRAPSLSDMHDLGDMLLRQGFVDPVLDVNHYTVNYRAYENLLKESYGSGMLSDLPGASDSDSVLPDENGFFPVTYEVVFAHAFAPQRGGEVSASSDGSVRVSLSHLRRQLRATGRTA